MSTEKEIARITELTQKFKSGAITVQEQIELDNWLNAAESNRLRFEERIKEEDIAEGLAMMKEAMIFTELDRNRIEYPEGTKVVPLYPPKYWLYTSVAAAFVIIVAGVFLWYSLGIKSAHPKAVASQTKSDLAPGGARALLILGDNTHIVLDSVTNGTIAVQGNSHIRKVSDGQLAYTSAGKAAAVSYNTISTPAGGQYEVTLPDGSKVWLNAKSFLRFPTVFTGATREVEMQGEAYFEISDNPHQPFAVKVNDMVVNVLGTHFNIMAYADERLVKATLLEGAIKVNRGVQSAVLLPGNEAQLDNSQLRVVNDVDVEETTAWKNGYFEFNESDIETVMRAMARWYDVTIQYEGEKTSHKLTAHVKRSKYASEVLRILEASGYHFEIKGKTIVVLP